MALTDIIWEGFIFSQKLNQDGRTKSVREREKDTEGKKKQTKKAQKKIQEEKSAELKWVLNNDEAPWQPAEPGILIWGWKQSDT